MRMERNTPAEADQPIDAGYQISTDFGDSIDMMTCKICAHPDRAAIDKALVDQRSLRDIAGQYEISRSAIDRHKKHIPKALTKAKQAETVAETTTLLSRVEKLAARCESMIDKAENAKDWRAAPAAARELRGCLELLAKLNGELQPNGTRVAINFGDVTKIDVRALTNEQLEMLYERLAAASEAEIHGMSNAEIDVELAEIALKGIPAFVSVREGILFDEMTVPPGPGYEANMRHDPKEGLAQCLAIGPVPHARRGLEARNR